MHFENPCHLIFIVTWFCSQLQRPQSSGWPLLSFPFWSIPNSSVQQSTLRTTVANDTESVAHRDSSFVLYITSRKARDVIREMVGDYSVRRGWGGVEMVPKEVQRHNFRSHRFVTAVGVPMTTNLISLRRGQKFTCQWIKLTKRLLLRSGRRNKKPKTRRLRSVYLITGLCSPFTFGVLNCCNGEVPTGHEKVAAQDRRCKWTNLEFVC